MPQLVIYPASKHLTLGSGMVTAVILRTAPAGCKAEIILENGDYRFRNLGPPGSATLNHGIDGEGTRRDGDVLILVRKAKG